MAKQLERRPSLRELFEEDRLDSDWIQAHAEAFEPLRGEWVLIEHQQIVAHHPDGTVLAEMVASKKHPNALLEYIPTRKESRGIRT